MSMSVEIRFATLEDVPDILRVDPLAEREERRYDYISRAIQGEMSRTVKVYILDGRLVAVSVLGDFFGHPFLELIATAPNRRRMGIASALLADIETSLNDDRFFVSANESNTVMRDLLVRRGYRVTGMVENLDPDDPEIFFVIFKAAIDAQIII
jgi:ribosomal protein S18 acetylase RimI-like enzyme